MVWVKRTILLLIGIIVLALVAGYVYLVPMGGFEKLVNSRLDALIESRYPLRVDIGSIDGTLISNVVINDIHVTCLDSTGDYPLAYIPRLSASYFLSDILGRHYELDELTIESPRITLRRDESGRCQFPTRNAAESSAADTTSGRTGGTPDISIGAIRIDDARVVVREHGDSLVIDSIFLAASVQFQEGTYSTSLRQLCFRSTREGWQLDNASGKVTLSESTVYAQDVSLVRGDTRVRLDGMINIKTGSGRASFDSDNLIVEDISVLHESKLHGMLDINGSVSFGDGRINGTVNLGGEFMDRDFENLSLGVSFADKLLTFDTLYGSVLGGCAVDGHGYIDFSGPTKTYRLDAMVKDFDLINLIHKDFSSDLNGSIVLTGESFTSSKLLLRTHVDLTESRFYGYSFHSGTGDLIITTDSLVFGDGFLFTYYENQFLVDGTIVYSHDVDIEVTAGLHNLDRYRGKLFIDQPGGRGFAEATLSGSTADPDLKGFFVSDSVWVYGLYADSFYTDFNVNRFLTGKQGLVTVSFYNGWAWSLPYDTGYAMLTLDSNLVYIDTACLSNPNTTVAGRGVFDYGVYPQRMVLDSLDIALFTEKLYNRGKFAFEIDSAGFNFTQAEIGNTGARLAGLGRVGYDETMGLDISAENIALAPWVNLFDLEVPLDGDLSFELGLNGTFNSPRFALTGTIDSLRYVDTAGRDDESLFLGDVGADVYYENTLLTIDSLVVSSHPGLYRANGFLHLDLALSADSLDRLPDERFDIKMTATDNRFDLVSLMLPSVEELNGDLAADVRLSGTPSEPHLEGFATLKRVSLKWFDLVDSIYTDTAGIMLTMHDNQIIVDGVEVFVKNKHNKDRPSYVTIDGDITVKSLGNFFYNLDVTIPKELPFRYELEDIEGVIEGELQIRGDTPPTVSGNLTVVSLMYRVPFAEVDEGSPIMMALAGENTWDLNIDLDILSNFWIKNEDLDAQLSGFVTLIREDGASRFLGEMEFIRGRGFLFDKTFRIDAGGTVVFQDIETLNPLLDMVAYTRITGVLVEGENTRESMDLCLNVSGTLEEPEWDVCEGSPFDRQDVLPLLVANYYSSGDTTTSSAFGERFSQLVGAQMSQIGTRHLSKLGVETFEIDPTYGGEFDLSSTRLTLGFYTVSNLYVYGRSTLSGQYGQEVGFEYRFNKTLLLEGRRSEEEEYILNLKLHWEFD